MGQMAYVGPMLGQHHQFHHYNPGKSNWGEERYFKITKTIYKDLDERLEKSDFLAGDYSIADIATFPCASVTTALDAVRVGGTGIASICVCIFDVAPSR